MIEYRPNTDRNDDYQREMSLLCSQIFDLNDGKRKVDESTPYEQSKQMILDIFKQLEDKINHLPFQSQNDGQYKKNKLKIKNFIKTIFYLQ